ncbi:MAG: hypothetical protein J5600_01315 [Desulfovibrio sp.]|jgi:hypothetical protein|nr:hypothetical protein [Desulfovibrio sp.]MBO4683948.1 hypothetical protein [Desulfovibrio sp.]MBQ1420865.1 hypothetical protein [Desulfovibrio sp.]MBQ4124906.1 hypothetical protein [Desulfovibrio sp.]MBR4746605.1 hypothetical protein [Desulfovibrio sp.]
MTSYVLLITLFLTEGGTLEAEEDTSLTSRQECVQEAARQEKALRREFAITKEERGICPFRDVKIRCEKAAPAR